MEKVQLIDGILDLINDLEDSRRKVSDISDEINMEGSSSEESELIESVDDQLKGAVEALDIIVQLLDVD